ncbi:hypothetical protein [Paucisalibacillus globulus]|nr:hypothetical protein [Paucisalibacillus globulus]
MRGFVDDLAGAIYDFIKFIIKGFSYLLTGMLIVGIPIFLFIWLINIFN